MRCWVWSLLACWVCSGVWAATAASPSSLEHQKEGDTWENSTQTVQASPSSSSSTSTPPRRLDDFVDQCYAGDQATENELVQTLPPFRLDYGIPPILSNATSCFTSIDVDSTSHIGSSTATAVVVESIESTFTAGSSSATQASSLEPTAHVTTSSTTTLWSEVPTITSPPPVPAESATAITAELEADQSISIILDGDEIAGVPSTPVSSPDESSLEVSVESPSSSFPSGSVPDPEISDSTSTETQGPEQSLVPPPEFLSYQEWRAKIEAAAAAAPAAKRAKRSTQRVKQDASTAGQQIPLGNNGFDGDNVDLGSLFTSEESPSSLKIGDKANDKIQPAGTQIVYEGLAGDDGDLVIQLNEMGDLHRMVILPPDLASDPLMASQVLAGSNSPPIASVTVADGASAPTPSMIQPLPNVGAGDVSDPLVFLRDRSNYAAFECAAMVHRSSPKTKGSSNILMEKKDRYMLTPCSADPKFVEIELCDEIRIDTIVLANFEFFSSIFKHFEVLASKKYPGKPGDWENLGTFRARNARGVQVFRTKAPEHFHRYVRINFLSHFGSEYYCPVSVFRVYGVTQIDAYRLDEERDRLYRDALTASEEEDAEDPLLDAVEEVEHGGEANQNFEEAVSEAEVLAGDVQATITLHPVDTSTTIDVQGISGASVIETQLPANLENDLISDSGKHSPDVSVHVAETMERIRTTTASIAVSPLQTAANALKTPSIASETVKVSSIATSNASTSDQAVSSKSAVQVQESPVVTLDTPVLPLSSSYSSSSPSHTISNPVSSPTEASSNQQVNKTSTAITTNLTTSTPTAVSSSATTSIGGAGSRSSVSSEAAATSIRAPPPIPPPILPPIPQSLPGESIYGTIMKRLSSLEQNHTLAMHYIEAQGVMLRDAFLRVEKRLGDSEALRFKHEQLARQALVEIEKHRAALDLERNSFTAQIALLSHELRVERRLGIVQLLGLVAVFIFVALTRGSPSPLLISSNLSLSQQAGRSNDSSRRHFNDPLMSGEDVRDHLRGPNPGDLQPLRSNSLSAMRAGSTFTKRHSVSAAKPAPRRHYGGVGSSSRHAKSPRSWTPPLRHSSAPPDADDDMFAFDPSDPLVRRRFNGTLLGSSSRNIRSPGGGGGATLGLAIDTQMSETPIHSKRTSPATIRPSRVPQRYEDLSDIENIDSAYSTIGGKRDTFSSPGGGESSDDQSKQQSVGGGAVFSFDVDDGEYQTTSETDSSNDRLSNPSPRGISVLQPRATAARHPRSSSGSLENTESHTPLDQLPSPPPELEVAQFPSEPHILIEGKQDQNSKLGNFL